MTKVIRFGSAANVVFQCAAIVIQLALRADPLLIVFHCILIGASVIAAVASLEAK